VLRLPTLGKIRNATHGVPSGSGVNAALRKTDTRQDAGSTLNKYPIGGEREHGQGLS